jgi:hypothetical protein
MQGVLPGAGRGPCGEGARVHASCWPPQRQPLVSSRVAAPHNPPQPTRCSGHGGLRARAVQRPPRRQLQRHLPARAAESRAALRGTVARKGRLRRRGGVSGGARVPTSRAHVPPHTLPSATAAHCRTTARSTARSPAARMCAPHAFMTRRSPNPLRRSLSAAHPRRLHKRKRVFILTAPRNVWVVALLFLGGMVVWRTHAHLTLSWAILLGASRAVTCWRCGARGGCHAWPARRVSRAEDAHSSEAGPGAASGIAARDPTAQRPPAALHAHASPAP